MQQMAGQFRAATTLLTFIPCFDLKLARRTPMSVPELTMTYFVVLPC